MAFSSRQFALNTIKHGLFFSASHYFSFLKPILMQSDWWIEKGGFRSETKSGILTQSKKCLFDPNFFDRAIRSAHPVEKIDLFNGMCGSDCSIERVFEVHRISHHPTRHTITPYNISDAGLAAIMLLLLLRTTRRGTSCSPPATVFNFRLPYSRVSNAPRKSTKQNKNYKLDVTDDKEGLQGINRGCMPL